MNGIPTPAIVQRPALRKSAGFHRIIPLLLYILLAALPVTGQELAAHLYIKGLEQASAPTYHQGSDSMVFTYQAEADRFQPRHVGVSFGHEQFARIHDMQFTDRRDEDGRLLSRVYFLFIPLTPDIEALEQLEYRYIVDGIWIEDPLNPMFREKISGRRVSLAQLPSEREILPVSPEINPVSETSRSKLVQFHFFGDPGQQVFLAGSFNNWDPFMYPLREKIESPGEYELTIRLLPGEYHYNYYYRGRRIKDPLNVRSSYDIEGYEYSTFSVDP
jgi:hypothetical protein